MALTVKKATLWRTEVPHRVGALADVLEPLAQAGGNLRVVMGYRYPGEAARAAIEIFPVTGRKATAAAKAAGLAAAATPCLLVEGDDRPGLGAAMAREIANAGINVSFLVAETVGRRFSAVLGFASEADAARAAKAVKSATKARRR